MSEERIIEMLNTATEENVWRKKNRDAQHGYRGESLEQE